MIVFPAQNQRHSLERRCLILVSWIRSLSFFGFASLRAISSTILGATRPAHCRRYYCDQHVGSLALNWRRAPLNREQ